MRYFIQSIIITISILYIFAIIRKSKPSVSAGGVVTLRYHPIIKWLGIIGTAVVPMIIVVLAFIFPPKSRGDWIAVIGMEVGFILLSTPLLLMAIG